MSKLIVVNVFDNYDYISFFCDDIIIVVFVVVLFDLIELDKVFVMYCYENLGKFGQKEIIFVDFLEIEKCFVKQLQWLVSEELKVELCVLF